MTDPGFIDLSDRVVVTPSDLGAPSLAAAIEALLIVADEPMSIETLASTTGRTSASVEATLAALAEDYRSSGRGFELRQTEAGWRYYTNTDCEVVVSRYVTEGQSARLSQAALETLAVIAYRQPVTRARISAVRGVNVDGVVRTLLNRGLVSQVGSEPATGAALYGTSEYFLERLGLSSIDDLPPLAPHVPIGEELDDIIDATE